MTSKSSSVLFPERGEPSFQDKTNRVFKAMGGRNAGGEEVSGIGNRIENLRDSLLGFANLEDTFPLIGRKNKMPRKLLPGERPSGGLRYPPGWKNTMTQADTDSRIAEGQELARLMHSKQAEIRQPYRRTAMNSAAFMFGIGMAKEAVKSPARQARARAQMEADMREAAKSGIDPRFAPAKQIHPTVAAAELGRKFNIPANPAAVVAAGEGAAPRAGNWLFGSKGLKGALGGVGRLGWLAAGGLGALGLWNAARTGSPFRHDTGLGNGLLGSTARNISRNDPLAQFGGMEPGAANYWDQVTMAALQREAQSQNALDRIRMLRRMGPSA